MKKIGKWILLVILASLAIGLLDKYFSYIMTAGVIAAICFIVYLIVRKKKAKPAARRQERKSPAGNIIECSVAGVTHYQREILSLGSKNEYFNLTKKELLELSGEDAREYEYEFEDQPAVLVQEPYNEYDSNAIRVEIGGKHVGYIPKTMCGDINPLLDSDSIRSVTASISGGRYRFLEPKDDDPSELMLRTSKISYYIKLFIRYGA